MSRKPLDIGAEFAPRPRQPIDQAALDAGTGWPSREAAPETERLEQLNIRAPASVCRRFRELCEANGRRTYPEMLVILMNNLEGEK